MYIILFLGRNIYIRPVQHKGLFKGHGNDDDILSFLIFYYALFKELFISYFMERGKNNDILKLREAGVHCKK